MDGAGVVVPGVVRVRRVCVHVRFVYVDASD